MPERDYTNDYEDWMLQNPFEYQGKPEPPQNYYGPQNPYEPAAPTSPTAAPPPAPGGDGRHPQAGPPGSTTPNMDPPGYRGGYWGDNGQWVNGEPYGGGPGGGGEGENEFGGQMQNPNEGFVWPTLSLPRAAYQDFGGFKPFKQPTQDEILGDPVLQAQLKEGNNRIKQDRAFRGILNTGDTLKDIFDWTSDRIKLGGHDAFDRAFKVYDVNERQNPFNTWSANKDKYFQEFNTNLPSIQNEFMFNQYNPAKALWDQNYNQWAKQGDWLTTMSRPIE